MNTKQRLIFFGLSHDIIDSRHWAGNVCHMSRRHAEVSHSGQLFATGQQGDNADVILWSSLAWHGGHSDKHRLIN